MERYSSPIMSNGAWCHRAACYMSCYSNYHIYTSLVIRCISKLIDYDECKKSDTFWLADRICLYITPSHYHYCANLSEDIEIIKCLSDIFVECVSKIKHIHSVIRYTIYLAVCCQFTQFPCDD